MKKREELHKRLVDQARRMKQAEHERSSLAGQTVYIGTLGLLFVLPVIGGAYVGHWMDTLASDYSSIWTTSLILLGVLLGILNVYLFIRE